MAHDRVNTVGIIGLGLIGTSLARALRMRAGVRVLGSDLDTSIEKKAVLTGAIDEALTEQTLGSCEVVILALYPQAALTWLETHAADCAAHTIITEVCGVKRALFSQMAATAAAHNLTYIGTHPMAGREKSGFDAAREDLFEGASLVLVPVPGTPIEPLERLKTLTDALGFTHYEIADPAEHDRIIAFTSQLPHIIACSYIESPTAADHHGFSAGSYRDVTRVAALNASMWTELFLENRDNLRREIAGMKQLLEHFDDALEAEDAEALHALLAHASARKDSLDGAKEAR